MVPTEPAFRRTTETRAAIEVPDGEALTLGQVEMAKVRVAIKASPSSMAGGIGGVIVISLLAGYTGEDWHFRFSTSNLVWAALLSLTLVIGMAEIIWSLRADPSDLAISRPLKHRVAGVCLTAGLWGSAGWLLVPAQTIGQDVIIHSTIGIILFGGATALGVCRPMVMGYGLTMTAVFATGFIRLGDPLHLMLGIGFFAYCGVALMNARNQEAAFASTMVLSIKNEALLAQRTQLQQAAEQAQAEAEAARDRAEIADRAKTTFIAAASHDLRQPMHALVQYVAHLRRISCDAVSGPTLEKVEDSIAAMEDLLNAVLDFSKFSIGSVKPNIESVEVAYVLNRIDTQMRPIAQAKGLSLVVQSRAGFVLSDEVLLERMLRNIVQNALRYTSQGKVVVRAVARGDVTRFLVSDSGIGIEQSELSRVFDEYYQVDNRARDRRKGLGLGLAIVRNLAGLLEIRVRLKSVVGRGSTFAIEASSARPLPAIERLLSVGAAVDCVRGALVVLIDDDPLARDGVKITLEDFGCRVIAVGSTAQALAALANAELPPQVIVSDYRLENGSNGLDAITAIIASQSALCGNSFKLPAMLISGDTSPDELQRVAAAGYPMLHKPVSVERLYAALNAMLTELANDDD